MDALRVQDWLAETGRAEWATAREESRMGKSGYAPKKAQLAEWIVEGRDIVTELVEQLETCREALDYISRLRHPNGNRFTEVGVANYARSTLAKVSSPASGERVAAGMPSSTSATAGASQSPEDSSPAKEPDA